MRLGQNSERKTKDRYHSEEAFQGVSLMKQRGGASSNTGKYMNKIKHFKTLPLNEEEGLACTKANIRSTNHHLPTLPKINAKLIQSTLTSAKKIGSHKPMFKARQQSKASKNRNHLDSLFKLEAERRFDTLCEYAYMTHEGTRVKNQDRIAVHVVEAGGRVYQYFAVFDGHGGHLASSYLANHLHVLVKELLQDNQPPKIAMANALKIVEEKLKKNSRLAHKSGSCALICLVSCDSIWVANVGDSRMLTISTKGEVAQLTRDHKPEEEIQRKRIEYNGGEVYRNRYDEHFLSEFKIESKMPFRVYPGKLSVTRTIGDIHLKKSNDKVIIAEPDIYELRRETGLAHLVLMSDGVYEAMGNGDIGGCFEGGNMQKGVQRVFRKAEKLGSQDNRSLIAVKLGEAK